MPFSKEKSDLSVSQCQSQEPRRLDIVSPAIKVIKDLLSNMSLDTLDHWELRTLHRPDPVVNDTLPKT